MILRATVIKATAIAIVVLVLMMFLVSCGDTIRSGNKTVDECTNGGGNNCVTTINYKGKPLHCVTWSGSHSEVGLACDFVEYHLNDLRTTDQPEGF